MTQRIVTLVTGGNRGIGYNIVYSLASHFPAPSRTAGPSFTYLVAGRQLDSAKKAVEDLKAGLGSEGVNDVDIQTVQLDVTDDKSIENAVKDVKERFGGLDVLVNNAGIAERASESLEKSRSAYNNTFNTNVTSIANTVAAFAPLLQVRQHGLVVNVSSSRGSLARSMDPSSARPVVIPYSVSKVALNSLTIEMAKEIDNIEFQAVCPGHCATEFNNYRGKRDPREGAAVVVMLVDRWMKGPSETGFWETVGDKWELSTVPW